MNESWTTKDYRPRAWEEYDARACM